MALEMGGDRKAPEARERGVGTLARGRLEISPDPRDHGFPLARSYDELMDLVSRDKEAGRVVPRRLLADVVLRAVQHRKGQEARVEIAERWDRSPDGELMAPRRRRWKPLVPDVAVRGLPAPTPEVVVEAVKALSQDNVVEFRANQRKLSPASRVSYDRKVRQMRDLWSDSGRLGPLFIAKGLYESGVWASRTYYKAKAAIMHDIVGDAYAVLDRHPTKAGRALYDALSEEQRRTLLLAAAAVTAFPPDPKLRRLEEHKRMVAEEKRTLGMAALEMRVPVPDPTFPRYPTPLRRAKNLESSAKLETLRRLLEKRPTFYADFWQGALQHAGREHLPWIAAMMLAGPRASETAGPLGVDGRQNFMEVSLTHSQPKEEGGDLEPLPPGVISIVVFGSKCRVLPNGHEAGIEWREVLVPYTHEALIREAEAVAQARGVKPTLPVIRPGDLAPGVWLAQHVAKHGGNLAIDPHKAFGPHLPLRKEDRILERGRPRTSAEIAKAAQNLVSRIGKKIGLEEPVTPHCFRHYRESRDKAVKILTTSELSQMAGHASERTTTLYGRASLGSKGGPVPTVGVNGTSTPRPRVRPSRARGLGRGLGR